MGNNNYRPSDNRPLPRKDIRGLDKAFEYQKYNPERINKKQTTDK